MGGFGSGAKKATEIILNSVTRESRLSEKRRISLTSESKR